jgi:uncharacterized protein
VALGALSAAWRAVLLAVAGVGAGVANGVAGGGTFITFPTLLALGIAPLQANVSSTVGLVPSVLGGVGVFRAELREHRATLRAAVPWCLVGSATGTAVLLTSPASDFRAAVPWLIGIATVLFALAPLITRALAARAGGDARRRALLGPGVLVASAYGGYFGAGLGIVLLAVLALALDEAILTLQGLRIALGLTTNLLAAAVFLVRGRLSVEAVAVLAASTLVGGWLGARALRRLPPVAVRLVVIAVGAATTVRLALG